MTDADTHPNAPPQEPPADKLPATRELTDAEKQRARMEALLQAVDQRADMLRTLLRETGITYERFVEVFRRAIIRGQAKPQTNLLRADAGSVIEACINACTDGLLPDGRQGAIVLYNTTVKQKGKPDRQELRANWQPMYQGLLDIAYKSGNFRSIEARVVYDGDQFDYELGDDGFIKHRPKARPAGTTQPLIIAAYAVAKTINGGVFREVFEGADIAKVNAVSKATSGPGKGWPEEMARKGPLRRMWKYLPKNEAMNRIVERDNEGFDLDAADLAALDEPHVEKKLRAGFGAPARPALTQGADPVMPATEMEDERELVPAGENGEQESTNPDEKSYAAEMAQGSDPVSGGKDASNEGEKIDMAQNGPEGAESSPPSEPAKAPEVETFESRLVGANTWLGIKQALKDFAKTEMGQKEFFDRIAKERAWARACELREEGKDKTDFVTDPLLFECWLVGAETDADSVAGNWAIVQADKAFERLPQEDRDRIAARVQEASGGGPVS